MRNSLALRALLAMDQPFSLAPTWTEVPGGGREEERPGPSQGLGAGALAVLEDVQGQH